MTARTVAVIGFALWLGGAVLMLLSQPTLGHDEAQYAIDALDTLAGAPARWFYLSPGMRALALPGVLVGGDTALRIIPLLGGLAFLAVVLRLGTRTVGLAGAAWTLVVLAGTKTFARYSIDLLSDLPACTCMLAALAIIVDELLGDHPPRWRLLACAPLLAGAFYVRYGSVVPIAVIVLAALGFGARRVTQAPGPVVATAALFAVLVAPHLLAAYRTTGSPLGIIVASSGVPGRAYVGEGLVDYVTSNPLRTYGLLVAPVVLAGLVDLVMRREHVTRPLAFLWVVALGDIVALGLVTHARPRYIYLGLALLLLLGTAAIVRAVRGRRPLAILCIGVTAVVSVMTLKTQLSHGAGRRWSMRATLAASRAIRADHPSQPCHVVGNHFTQLEWYAGCSGRPIDVAATAARGEPVYIVRDETPTWRDVGQPDTRSHPHRIVTLVPGMVEVVRLTTP